MARGSTIGASICGFPIITRTGCASSSLLHFDSCGLVMLNTATHGGGINNYPGTLTITLSVILGNSAIGDGGGIYNAGTSTITSSTICGNDVNGSGGGIYISWSTITIGGSHYLDFDNFNVFTDNKKNGTISAYQHIRDLSGDCRSSYPNNFYNPNN